MSVFEVHEIEDSGVYTEMCDLAGYDSEDVFSVLEFLEDTEDDSPEIAERKQEIFEQIMANGI